VSLPPPTVATPARQPGVKKCPQRGNSSIPYVRQRFPPEIIAHCVLLRVRLPLSLRVVDEMLLLRGAPVRRRVHVQREAEGLQPGKGALWGAGAAPSLKMGAGRS